MAQVRRIFGNTLYLTVSSALRKVITLVYYVIVARYAGLNVTGLFYLAIAYGSIFYVVIDLGLTNLFIRNVSREPGRLNQLLSELLSTKLVLASVGTLGTVVLLQWLRYPAITNHLIYIVVVTMVLQSFSAAFYACFRALQDLRFEAGGMVAGKLGMLTLGGGAVFLGLSPYFLIGAIALDSVANFLIGLYIVKRRLKPELRFSFLAKLPPETMSVAGPFMLSALFAEIYSFDTVVLQKFMGESVVAVYSVAARPISSLRFVPAMLAAVLFPTFSSLYKNSRLNLDSTFVRSQHVMVAMATPLMIWGVVSGPAIIDFVFGSAYGPSVGPFQIMALGLLPMFLTYPVLALLNACNMQKRAAGNLAVSTVVHVMLSVWLIPRYGVTGAAIASTLSATGLAGSCWYSVQRVANVSSRGFSVRMLKASAAALPMLAVLWVVDMRANFVVALVSSAMAYITGLYFVEGIEGGRFRSAAAKHRFNELARTVFRNDEA